MLKRNRRSSLLCLFFCLYGLSTITAEPEASIADDGGLTREQVLLYGGISYASVYLGALSEVLIPQPYMSYVFAAINLAGTIPHVCIDPAAGLGEMGASIASYGAGFALAAESGFYGDATLSNMFNNLGLKTSMWSDYEGYAKARQMAKSGEYPSDYKPERYSDLLAAPWQPEELGRPSVWISILANAAADVLRDYYSTGGATAVWNTGKAYIGQSEVPIGLGLVSTMAIAMVSYTATGIGEEAVFRGIGYDEMRISLGVVPAKIIDALGFQAVHIPQYVEAGESAATILETVSLGTLDPLGLQWAYDNGGLRASVAQHMWLDVIASVVNYFFEAGVTRGQDTSLSLNIQVPIRPN
jgi:membrane protease YdiL (CAAX protease family)